ncbi:MAG: VanZ family protein [Acidimicrobiia bacterium]|nr:VanZ family protein [Acidimicrobiia bacterium]
MSWLVMAAALGWIVYEYRRRGKLNLRSLVIAGLGLWLVATLAITIYPIRDGYVDPGLHRLDMQSFVPLWVTVESFVHADGYVMSEEEWLQRRADLAVEWGVPIEEVKLDRRVRGPGVAVLRDPIGNLVLFTPLGLLGAAGWRSMRSAWNVLSAAALISGGIELSQLFLGLGSLGTIDDVIFNSLGALVGLAAFSATMRLLNPVASSGGP